MSGHTIRSYEKFNYLLRPSKQVERKLFIEALHHLRAAGYPIYDYTYLGLGSVFYADFILFHKYLYIDKMICAEKDEISRRMRFNKPFGFVKLVMKPVSDLIAGLNRQAKYIVWLDYDTPLNSDILQDVYGFTQVLSPGSILLLTVEAEPRLSAEGFEDLSLEQREESLLEYFQDEFSRFSLGGISAADVSRNELPVLLSRIMRTHIASSLVSRPDLQFHQMFNFLYADGCQMLSLGGIIDESGATKRLRDSGVLKLKYVRTGDRSKTISVPPLTTREKGWIDKDLMTSGKKKKKGLGLDDKLLRNYAEFYKYYPNYYEALV